MSSVKLYTLYWLSASDGGRLSVVGRATPIARLYRMLDESVCPYIESQFGRRISIQDLEATLR